MKRRFTFLLLVIVQILRSQVASDTQKVSLLCFGDINLGRTLGQMLLQGNVDYPFAKVRDRIQQADITFANLESIISDQNGETVSPQSNIIFCAPPVAADVLRNASISIVSLANNHAFDYGEKGIRDTRRFLDSAGIVWVGLIDKQPDYTPTVFERNGIKIAFLAYTQFINFRKGALYISIFDSNKVSEEIRLARLYADFIVASYHGGREYANDIDSLALSQMNYLVECGANVVIGHHPHVPLGIRKKEQSYIFTSLGNFVFYQPQRFWTQYGLAVNMEITKINNACIVTNIELIPLKAGYQPTFEIEDTVSELLYKRLQKLSNITIEQIEKGYRVELQ